TYTVDLADAVTALLGTGQTGLFQVTSGGDCCWHEFAAAIFEYSGIEAKLSPTTSAAFGAPARRPAYSVMSNAKLVATGTKAPRHWRDALRAYLEERKRKSS